MQRSLRGFGDHSFDFLAWRRDPREQQDKVTLQPIVWFTNGHRVPCRLGMIHSPEALRYGYIGQGTATPSLSAELLRSSTLIFSLTASGRSRQMHGRNAWESPARSREIMQLPGVSPAIAACEIMQTQPYAHEQRQGIVHTPGNDAGNFPAFWCDSTNNIADPLRHGVLFLDKGVVVVGAGIIWFLLWHLLICRSISEPVLLQAFAQSHPRPVKHYP